MNPARIEKAFEENFQRGEEVGAALSIWREGREVVSLFQGFADGARSIPWTAETLVLIWSATKGISSACLLHALNAAGSGLQTRVIDLWPEFGAGGKAAVTVGELMSHQAGLAALDEAAISVFDHEALAASLAAQTPNWDPGVTHGYGPRTYGVLADELVRRLTGMTLGEYFRREFAEPLELQIWIGLPEAEHHRVAQMLPARMNCEEAETPFHQAMSQAGTLTRRAFSAPAGLAGASAMNSPAVRSASLPSLGAIASVSSLGKFYAVLAAGGQWQGRSYFAETVRDWMTHPLANDVDEVLLTDTAFSAGFMLDPVDPSTGEKKRRLLGPSLRAFGHPGAGGSLAFADPENRLAFAYAMNQMQSGILPGARAQRLVDAIY